MANKIVTIKEGQSLFDIALQMYGSIESVFTIIQANPSIVDIHSNITRLSIEYEEQNTDLTKYFSTNNKSISTNYPVVNSDRSFDDSFDLSFR